MLRFTIRDVLWLTALVAMGLGWFADIRRRDIAIQAAKLQVEDAEFRIDRARAETVTARQMAEKHEKDIAFGFRLELARLSPTKRAEFEREYPKQSKLFFPDTTQAVSPDEN